MDPGAVKEQEMLSTLKEVDKATEIGDSAIQKFYEDAVILVTGGSGFLGKQLIEKLSRSCNIKKIYIILRPKKGKTIEQRWKIILECPVFDSVRQKKPEFVERLVPIEGNIVEPKLGFTEEIWHKLTTEVNVVFHTAATVSFKENLRTSTLVNVKGTIEMLKFGKTCLNLRSFVHVSTAFSHATISRKRSEVREEFYTSPFPPTTLVELAENIDANTLERIAPILLQDGRNSYLFTKAVSEEAVRILSDDMQICIVRPAIVVSSYREPAPGWIDINNVNGPSGLLLGIGLGVMHTFIVDTNIRVDLVPVDIVNNGIIVAGWETGTCAEKNIKIYTVTAARNYMTWGYLSDVIANFIMKYVSPKAVWYSFTKVTKNEYVFLLLTLVLHFIPATLVDAFLLLMRKKPIAIYNYKLMYNLSRILQYFAFNYWIYNDDNFVKMTNKMSEIDKKIFNIDIMSVDMRQLMVLWYIGLRRYIIKDGLKGNENAQRKQVFFKMATYILAPLYLYSLYKLFAYIFYSLYCLFLVFKKVFM